MSGSFILSMLILAALVLLRIGALAVSFVLRRLHKARIRALAARLEKLHLEVRAWPIAGDAERAIACARKWAADPEVTVAASALNLLVNELIAAGRYREALGVSLTPVAADKGWLAVAYALLVEINQAEAEYNLGLWAEADDRMQRIEQRSLQFGITRAGLRQQRAWIAAHQGRAQEALTLSEQIDPKGLPADFLAEYHFTKVVVRLAVGELDEAARAAEEASAAVVRPSSARNALFIHARVAAARGDWATAEARCREAAEHKYRGQGGDGLLLWGDALAQLQRGEEAKAAWRLAIERDGESESARLAAERLKS